jgi:hypothetical protein
MAAYAFDQATTTNFDDFTESNWCGGLIYNGTDPMKTVSLTKIHPKCFSLFGSFYSWLTVILIDRYFLKRFNNTDL